MSESKAGWVDCKYVSHWELSPSIMLSVSGIEDGAPDMFVPGVYYCGRKLKLGKYKTLRGAKNRAVRYITRELAEAQKTLEGMKKC